MNHANTKKYLIYFLVGIPSFAFIGIDPLNLLTKDLNWSCNGNKSIFLGENHNSPRDEFVNIKLKYHSYNNYFYKKYSVIGVSSNDDNWVITNPKSMDVSYTYLIFSDDFIEGEKNYNGVYKEKILIKLDRRIDHLTYQIQRDRSDKSHEVIKFIGNCNEKI
jgi:hypothetical protein